MLWLEYIKKNSVVRFLLCGQYNDGGGDCDAYYHTETLVINLLLVFFQKFADTSDIISQKRCLYTSCNEKITIRDAFNNWPVNIKMISLSHFYYCTINLKKSISIDLSDIY
jgi:hypothetical protein